MALTVNSKKEETTEIAKYDLETAVLAELDTKYKDFQLDPDNADSKAMLMAGLRDYRNMRLAVVEWHKVQKADIVKIGRALDSEKARVIDLIFPGENHLKTIRKAEDDRLAAIEKKRIDNIRTMLNDIRNMDYKLPELNLKEMQSLKKEIESTPILEEEYQEFVGEAMASVHNVLIAINNAIEQRVKFDREEGERKAENERLEKIRKEQEVAQAKIDEAERKLKLAKETAEGEIAAAQARIDLGNQKIQDEKDKLETEKKEEENKRRFAAIEKEAQEQAEKRAAEKVKREKQEEVEKIEADRVEKKRQEALMPDKDKVLGFCDMIDHLTPPRCKDKKCNVILNSAMKEIYGIAGKIRAEIEEL